MWQAKLFEMVFLQTKKTLVMSWGDIRIKICNRGNCPLSYAVFLYCSTVSKNGAHQMGAIVFILPIQLTNKPTLHPCLLLPSLAASCNRCACGTPHNVSWPCSLWQGISTMKRTSLSASLQNVFRCLFCFCQGGQSTSAMVTILSRPC